MREKQPISIQVNHTNAIIQFVRPEIKNSLSIEVLEILSRTFEKLDSNSRLKRIIFTGSEDTFAAGANLNEVSALDENTSAEFGLRGQKLMQKIYRSEKQTFAAIDGFCMGGALDLALSCRFRIASPGSVFAHPGAKLGIITGWSGTQLLPRLIGRKKALEIFVTAKSIKAQKALKIGLIDEICENPLAALMDSFKK